MIRKIKTPHDTYFQNMMEIIEVARSFFIAYLIPKIAQELDWNTLQIADSARRGPNSRSTYTDITYVCYTKAQNIPIYLHVEQERKIDPYIVERILQYNLRLFAKHKKQGNKKLPIIINFIVYNGTKQKKYPYFENFCDYFDIPWMAELLLGKFFFLVNLNEQADSLLASHEFSSMMEILLKRASDSNFITWLKDNYKLIGSIPSERVFPLILSLSLEYALQVGRAKAEEILEAFSNIYPQLKETIMTAARQLERRGEKRGEKRGIELGIKNRNLAIAQNMLNNGELIEKIIRYTGLSKEAIEELRRK